MSIQANLDQSIKEAMRAKDSVRLNVLRAMKSALKYKSVEKADHNLSEQEEIAVLRSLIKQRQDSVEQYEKAGAADRAAIEKQEIAVVEEFLPQPLSADELAKIVEGAIQSTGASSMKDMGAVMKKANEEVAGRADGKTLSSLVKEKLSQAS